METNQDQLNKAFNQSCTHLITQGERALSLSSKCMYRGTGGTSCAVGCLITDDAYDESIENSSVRSDEVKTALRFSGWEVDYRFGCMLDGLQTIHDHAYNGFDDEESVKRHWRDVVEQYNLDVNTFSDTLKEHLGYTT